MGKLALYEDLAPSVTPRTEEVVQSREEWVELARRSNDGLIATLHTLGERAMADVQAMATVTHKSGVSITREGTLQDVAPVYVHPMVHMSEREAKTAYPPRNHREAEAA